MNLIDLIPLKTKKRLREKNFNANSTILFAEKENKYVYFLINGVAEAYVPGTKGAFATLHLYKPGSFFGEIEQFYEGRKPVEITAITDCIVKYLHKDDFLDWLKNDFEAVKFIIKDISYKLVINAELLEEILLLTVKERFLRCIALHYYRNTLESLTKDQILKEINTPLRSVNRAISQCSEEKILAYKNKKFIILNEKELLKNLPQY